MIDCWVHLRWCKTLGVQKGTREQKQAMAQENDGRSVKETAARRRQEEGGRRDTMRFDSEEETLADANGRRPAKASEGEEVVMMAVMDVEDWWGRLVLTDGDGRLIASTGTKIAERMPWNWSLFVGCAGKPLNLTRCSSQNANQLTTESWSETDCVQMIGDRYPCLHTICRYLPTWVQCRLTASRISVAGEHIALVSIRPVYSLWAE